MKPPAVSPPLEPLSDPLPPEELVEVEPPELEPPLPELDPEVLPPLPLLEEPEPPVLAPLSPLVASPPPSPEEAALSSLFPPQALAPSAAVQSREMRKRLSGIRFMWMLLVPSGGQ
jgi:hypothetical protein